MAHTMDLTGKTMVITGATSGIGRASLEALVRQGAHVIGVGRSHARCQVVQQAVLADIPHARLTFLTADLSAQREIRRLAADIQTVIEDAGGSRLDVLVNNAGTVSSWYAATEDGYELQFAVNHLAPFLLTHALLPLLRQAPDARVITVSSGSHYRTRMHWQDVMYHRRYNCLSAYKQSKLANVLFTAELNRRLTRRARVQAFAVDPGLVNTEIGLKGTSGLEKVVWQMRRAGGVTPDEGAQTVIYLASAPWVDASRSVYWKDCEPTAPSLVALHPDEASRLWSLSERLCGVTWQ